MLRSAHGRRNGGLLRRRSCGGCPVPGARRAVVVSGHAFGGRRTREPDPSGGQAGCLVRTVGLEPTASCVSCRCASICATRAGGARGPCVTPPGRSRGYSLHGTAYARGVTRLAPARAVHRSSSGNELACSSSFDVDGCRLVRVGLVPTVDTGKGPSAPGPVLRVGLWVGREQVWIWCNDEWLSLREPGRAGHSAMRCGTSRISPSPGWWYPRPGCSSRRLGARDR